MADLAETLSPTQGDRLDQAEALVRAYCGWHIAPSQPDTYTVRTYGNGTIFLPSLHVTSVESVTEADAPLGIGDEYLWLAPSGIITRRGGRWAYDSDVVVEFTHGYEQVPAEVTAVVQAIANRAVDNPSGVTREQMGPFARSFSLTGANEASTVALLESEKAALSRYRLPGVA
jgi:hypothetical protein